MHILFDKDSRNSGKRMSGSAECNSQLQLHTARAAHSRSCLKEMNSLQYSMYRIMSIFLFITLFLFILNTGRTPIGKKVASNYFNRSQSFSHPVTPQNSVKLPLLLEELLISVPRVERLDRLSTLREFLHWAYFTPPVTSDREISRPSSSTPLRFVYPS